jgi:hypothetical protein
VEKWKMQLANELSVVVDRKHSLGLLDRTLSTIVVQHVCGGRSHIFVRIAE